MGFLKSGLLLGAAAALALQPPRTLIGDFNSDGLDDIVFHTTQGSHRLHLVTANDDGTFSPMREIARLRYSPKQEVSLDLGDFNGDGDIDILAYTADSTGTPQYTVLFNQRDETFSEHAPPALPPQLADSTPTCEQQPLMEVVYPTAGARIVVGQNGKTGRLNEAGVRLNTAKGRAIVSEVISPFPEHVIRSDTVDVRRTPWLNDDCYITMRLPLENLSAGFFGVDYTLHITGFDIYGKNETKVIPFTVAPRN